MIKRQAGFTLVELLVVLVIFSLAIAAATGIFVPLLNQFKQQSKIAETNIEGVVGLELMRVDIEHAGVGLPWSFQSGSISYAEATVAPASAYNDAPGNVPRAIVAGYSLPLPILNNSDYLVVKSAVAGTNATSQQWTYITQSDTVNGGTAFLLDLKNNLISPWSSWSQAQITQNALQTNAGVIVIMPEVGGQGTSQMKELIMNGSTFYTTFTPSFNTNFIPHNNTYLIYGITDPGTTMSMPFNRADFYVQRPAANMPQRCASGTGILYRATVKQMADSTGPAGALTATPILDCVADMHVIFGFDTNANGIIDTYSNADGSSITPGAEPMNPSAFPGILSDSAQLRQGLVEVRVYILAHEGQRDPYFTFTDFTPSACGTCVRLGENALPYTDFDLSTIPNYLNYRWKVYTMVVKPTNLQ